MSFIQEPTESVPRRTRAHWAARKERDPLRRSLASPGRWPCHEFEGSQEIADVGPIDAAGEHGTLGDGLIGRRVDSGVWHG